MNWIRKKLIQLGWLMAEPRGRQEAVAKPKASMRVRVYRAATDTWEEVK